MRTTLDIHGTRCAVHADTGAVAEAVRRVVAHLGLPLGTGTASLALRVVEGDLPPVPTQAPTSEYEGGYLRAWVLGKRIVLRTRHVAVVIRPEDGHAEGAAAVKAALLVLVQELAVVLLPALLVLLRPLGFFGLHAAALARDGRGLLLVGASDAGKSTTAFNLVRHGWDFLSDDSVLLQRVGSGVEACSFRRTFGLDAEAEAFFPELVGTTGRQPADPDKRSVPMAELYPERAVARCRPRLLLLPEIVARRESSLVRASKTEALLGLAGQSALLHVRPDWTAPHLTLLGDLVRQVEAYHLHAGRDLLDDPKRILDLLTPLGFEATHPTDPDSVL